MEGPAGNEDLRCAMLPSGDGVVPGAGEDGGSGGRVLLPEASDVPGPHAVKSHQLFPEAAIAG